MKEITRIEKVYDFNELSESAKDNARLRYIENFRDADCFSDMIDDDMNRVFPNSKLETEFSLSCCQGDGLNVYGMFSIKDVVKLYREEIRNKKDRISRKENRFLSFLETMDFDVKLENNKMHYTYFTDKTEDIRYFIEFELENRWYRGIPYDFIHKISEVVNDGLKDFCKTWEDEGYSYFYEVDDDEEIMDCWEANGYEGWSEDGEPVYF